MGELTGSGALNGITETVSACHANASGQPDSSVCFLSAPELARLIRAKQISARELLAEHLKQIERVNPGATRVRAGAS